MKVSHVVPFYVAQVDEISVLSWSGFVERQLVAHVGNSQKEE